jgi:predicted RNA-binding Zn ribbon-like protein
VRLEANIVDLTAKDRAFRFGSGSVSLDLVATVGERWRRSFERLVTPADLARWLAEAGLIESVAAASERHLLTARRLRCAIFQAVMAAMADRSIPRSALNELNHLAAGPASTLQLRPNGTVRRESAEPIDAALADIARDAITLLANSDRSRLRECANAECSRLFVDRSPPGRRRWCQSNRCGNQAKTAAYRRRVARLRTAWDQTRAARPTADSQHALAR